jgi:hypothetical protein
MAQHETPTLGQHAFISHSRRRARKQAGQGSKQARAVMMLQKKINVQPVVHICCPHLELLKCELGDDLRVSSTVIAVGVVREQRLGVGGGVGGGGEQQWQASSGSILGPLCRASGVWYVPYLSPMQCCCVVWLLYNVLQDRAAGVLVVQHGCEGCREGKGKLLEAESTNQLFWPPTTFPSPLSIPHNHVERPTHLLHGPVEH